MWMSTGAGESVAVVAGRWTCAVFAVHVLRKAVRVLPIVDIAAPSAHGAQTAVERVDAYTPLRCGLSVLEWSDLGAPRRAYGCAAGYVSRWRSSSRDVYCCASGTTKEPNEGCIARSRRHQDALKGWSLVATLHRHLRSTMPVIVERARDTPSQRQVMRRFARRRRRRRFNDRRHEH